MTPQTVTITTARGETFTMHFDGPVSVEVKDAHLSPFEVGDMTPRTQSTAHEYKLLDRVLTPCNQVGIVVTVYSTNGVTEAYRVEVPDGRKIKFSPWELRPHTPSTAPKFKVGDVVYWENSNGVRYYGRVVRLDENKVYYETLNVAPCRVVGWVEYMFEIDLHHDYRTVAGGGWRKCEVGKRYKTVGGGKWHFHGGVHDENGYPTHPASPILIEELP